jgi:hypothetical protein
MLPDQRLEVLILRDGKTGRTGTSAASLLKSDKPFYGTSVGPGWYQSGTRITRGCKLLFSASRMLI